MKPNGFRSIYLTMLGIIILIGLGAYLNIKSENKTKLSLTQKLSNLSSNIGKKASSTDIVNKQNLSQFYEEKSNDNMLTKERLFTEDEIQNISESSFTDLLKDIERRMPKKSNIKKLPAEALHQTPPMIIEAGRDLGLIKEIIKSHPTYEMHAIKFYNQCANEGDVPTTIQAICLTNLILIHKKNGTDFNLSKFPKEIVELSKIVTDL